jgi:subtilisin family serine protease
MKGVFLLGISISISASVALVEAQERPRQRVRVERAADLPRHAYPLATTAGALLDDTLQFNVLARQLEADLRSDLATYIIADVATLKQYYGTLSALALVRGKYDAAVSWQDSIRAIEDKPAARLMAGVIERSFADASHGPRDEFVKKFRESLHSLLSALPYAQVRADLSTLKEALERSESPGGAAFARQMLDEQVRDGSLTLAGAHILTRLRMAMEIRRLALTPVMVAVLTEVVNANYAVKPDIWPARDVSLEGQSGLTPVVIAIWDSGVDVELFPGRLFVNANEIAGNGRDDDGNGFVDDVHGIAYDLNHDRRTGVLAPVDLTPLQQELYHSAQKAQRDMRRGITSPELQALRARISSMSQADAKQWFDGMNRYGEFIHGTHVAGIAMRNNPAARLLVARNEEDNFKERPQLVTIEGERKRAKEYLDTVEYFKRNGVRVVNMSWAVSPKYYVDILAKNQSGGDPETRERLGREMFDIFAPALRQAIESAPQILFVTAAGNDNDDGRFVERVPATFDLPNIMTAGAVDHAGDEASFTSYGKVDVHANGSEIESLVPGGAVVPVSGTSMATPQVVNLAAKLLALKPTLTAAEVRRVIMETADEKRIGEGKIIRVLNPKAAVERVRGSGGR